MRTTWLRGAAISLAALAVADPVWTLRRSTPPNVHLRVSSPLGVDATAVRDELVAALEGDVTFEDGVKGAASVVIGDNLPEDAIRDGMSVSIVALHAPGAPNIVVTAIDPPPTIAGWTTRLPATVRAQGLAGRTSEVVLEHQGTVMARAEHRWTRDDEVFDPGFSFVPPEPGVLDFSLVVRPIDGRLSSADHRTDVRLLAEARSLKVLTYEPRASWAATFVRRTLEADPVFEASALIGASRNIQVRSGHPPRRVDFRELERYDLVLVGAPEELSGPDVDTLERFVRERGGAVVLLADSRPKGPYTRLLPARTFEEWLADPPRAISTTTGSLHGAEFALAEALPAGVEVIATVSQDPSLNRGNRERAVVFGWPAGAGRFVFSGALDAWRERDRGDGFGQFWRAQIAAAAAASPRALTASVAPGMAAPGSTVRVHARLRPTAFDLVAARVLTPEVTARVIAPSGAERQVRLWPASQPGAFEGRLEAGVAGDYDVQVTTSNGASGNTVLRVRPGVATPELADTDLAAVARATGGVAVDATDLSPLLRHLRALPAERRLERAHPTRSIWWSAAFATLLCLEWAGRRRTGAP